MIADFIPYEKALALKELGFDEPCFGWYPNDTAALSLHGVFIGKPSSGSYKLLAYAPTFSQAFRWFREKHGWYVDLFVDDDKTFGFMITYFIDECRVDKPIKRGFSTYREAELASIDMLLETVKSSVHGK